jgi:N-methylhydantoinase A
LGIMLPDVSSCGAGGGSIGWVDSLGLVRMGPQSAGADPGPACYGKGGEEPTTTDAALVLGYIPDDYFCGGKIPLSPELARKAVKKIADKMHMTIEQAAEAMFTTVNHNMADEITEVSTRMGYDVRDFALLAIGGGGPLCGAFIADALGMKEVIVPPFAASFCAWSMFTLDIGRDYVRSYITLHQNADPEEMERRFAAMMEESFCDFKPLKVARNEVQFERYADLRYKGQYHDIQMELPAKITPETITGAIQAFHKKHQELFTFSLPWVPIEFRNLRLIAKVPVKKRGATALPLSGTDASAALKRSRKGFVGGQFIDMPVYDSRKLRPGTVIPGPAIVEEPTTTVVIPQDFTCTFDAYENYVMRRA